MLKTHQKDNTPMIINSALTMWLWPTRQRARANLVLMRTCIRKKKTRSTSSSVCIYLACCKGKIIRFHQAYPETRKMIIKIRSIQAQILLILTKSRPALKEFTILAIKLHHVADHTLIN